MTRLVIALLVVISACGGRTAATVPPAPTPEAGRITQA